MFRSAVILLLLVTVAPAATKRVLYITHSAGYRHDSIPTSQAVMEQLGARSSGAFEVVSSEDLSLISAETLRGFDVLYFFTSGELELSDQQKADLLEFVREGKGFGGVHSATDTLYKWPEYGDLIGGYFNGHPWAQEVTIRVEDRDHPIARGFEGSFRISDEIYQFRDFSRARVICRGRESHGKMEIFRWPGIGNTAKVVFFIRLWAMGLRHGSMHDFSP